MAKIKILVVPSDRTGVGKFRSVDPHIFLQTQYPDDFHVDIVYDIPMNDLNFFKDGKLTYNVAALRPVGDYWESLNPKNQWGGNWKSFKDVPHFQRTV